MNSYTSDDKEFIIITHNDGIKREFELLDKVIKNKWNMKTIRGEFKHDNDVDYLNMLELLISDADKEGVVGDLKSEIKSSIDKFKQFKKYFKKETDKIIFYLSYDPKRENGKWIYDYNVQNIDELKNMLIHTLGKLDKVEEKQYNERMTDLFNYINGICFNFQDVEKMDILTILDRCKNMLLSENTKDETIQQIKKEKEEEIKKINNFDMYS